MVTSIWENIASRLRKIKNRAKNTISPYWNLCQFNICFSETREWSKADWLLSQFVFCEFTEYYLLQIVYKICETCNAWKIKKWNSIHVKWCNASKLQDFKFAKKASKKKKKKVFSEIQQDFNTSVSVGMVFRFVTISS